MRPSASRPERPGATKAGRCSFLIAISALLLSGVVESTAAQVGESATGSLRVEPVIGVTHFKSSLFEGPGSTSLGVTVGGLVGMGTGRGLEVTYTYLPRTETISRRSPGLRVFRVMAIGSLVPAEDSRTILTGGLGASSLTLSAFRIDCGEAMSVCGEWAPMSGTRTALSASGGMLVRLPYSLDASGSVRLHRLVGDDDWSAGGDSDWLPEFSLGLRLRRGG